MPRHLISDAHEWINEIPTVPIYYFTNPPSESPQRGLWAWDLELGRPTSGSSTGQCRWSQHQGTSEVKFRFNRNTWGHSGQIELFRFVIFSRVLVVQFQKTNSSPLQLRTKIYKADSELWNMVFLCRQNKLEIWTNQFALLLLLQTEPNR
jgi:hypothetical protein